MKRVFTSIILFGLAAAQMLAVNLWSGSRTYSNGRATPKADDRVVIDAAKFFSAVVGQRLLLLLSFVNYADDPIANHEIRICRPLLYTSLADNVRVAEGDQKSSVTIDATMLELLQTYGLVISGTGFTLTAIDLEPANGTLWEGVKVVSKSDGYKSGTIPASLLSDAKAADVLLIEAEKTASDAQCILKVKGSWGDLSSDEAKGNVLADFKDTGRSVLKFTLNEAAAKQIRSNGLIVTGTGYTLYAVSLTSATHIRNIGRVSPQTATTVYDLKGVKVGNDLTPLPHGIYIVNGKKVIK